MYVVEKSGGRLPIKDDQLFSGERHTSVSGGQLSATEGQLPVKVFFLDSVALRRVSHLLYDIPQHPDHEIQIVVSMAEVRAYAMSDYAGGRQALDGIAMIQSCAECGYYHERNDIKKRRYERSHVSFCAMPAQPHQRELITSVFTQQLLCSSETGGAFSMITAGSPTGTPHEQSGQACYGEFHERTRYDYTINWQTVGYVTTSFLIEAAEDYLRQCLAKGEAIDPHDLIVVSDDRITCLDATAMGWRSMPATEMINGMKRAGVKALSPGSLGVAVSLA